MKTMREAVGKQWVSWVICVAVGLLLGWASPTPTANAQIAPSSAGGPNWQYPWTDAFAITPSDSTDFTYMARGIYVGTGGNVVVVMMDGTAATFSNVASGSILPVMAKRVNSTSTTATNLLGGK